MEILEGTILRCGCCGTDFATWKNYQDQDQDEDYGICCSCQFDLHERNEAEYDQLIDTVKTGLTPENLAEFEAKDRDAQKSFAYHCLERGYITITIGART